MSGNLTITNSLERLTIGQFHGKCFLYRNRLHVVTVELSKMVNGAICLDLVNLQIVDLPVGAEITPVDVEMLIT